MNAITFAGVSKSYGTVRAVETLDLEIGSGQAVALLGPNGAGKSTSIGMLLGSYARRAAPSASSATPRTPRSEKAGSERCSRTARWSPG
jgi:ABC-type multidrug transport system ATPase subunit